jgi:hypothetical protein
MKPSRRVLAAVDVWHTEHMLIQWGLNAGESCAKTSVRLTDMVQMLEKLAMEKVTAGEDESAKAVLKARSAQQHHRRTCMLYVHKLPTTSAHYSRPVATHLSCSCYPVHQASSWYRHRARSTAQPHWITSHHLRPVRRHSTSLHWMPVRHDARCRPHAAPY